MRKGPPEDCNQRRAWESFPIISTVWCFLLRENPKLNEKILKKEKEITLRGGNMLRQQSQGKGVLVAITRRNSIYRHGEHKLTLPSSYNNFSNAPQKQEREHESKKEINQTYISRRNIIPSRKLGVRIRTSIENMACYIVTYRLHMNGSNSYL